MEKINGVIEISPRAALQKLSSGSILLDVREQNEWDAGFASGAHFVPMSKFLETFTPLKLQMHAEILLICRSGGRSRQVGEYLAQQGFEKIYNVSGGTLRWHEENLPMQQPEIGLDDDARERYARHLALPNIAAEGQIKLINSRVLLVGVGGLGSPAAFYLAAAGVGTLRVIDPDVVDKSNLQRQILHTNDRIGEFKVQSAAKTLSALNPQIKIEAFVDKIDANNVLNAIENCDVVIDGADNLATRYILNEACAKLGVPLVYGAIHRFEGQVSVFDVKRGGPCYRCLFPVDDGPLVLNCAEAGVLGVLPGVIGSLQASEALKLLLGIGTPLIGRLLCFDALAAQFKEIKLPRDLACDICNTVSTKSTLPNIVCQH